MGRRTGIESLEERALLSATPLGHTSSVLESYSATEAGQDVVAVSVESTNAVVDVIDVSSAVSEQVASSEGYDIDYDLLESGNVRVLGQTGVQKVSTMTYCEVTDSIYIELWEKAISRWEEVIAEGVEDVVYPYAVDGQEGLVVDDLYLYFGFSDSFSSSSSLGSALNAGYYRDGGSGIAATGSLVFNANYFVANPSESIQTVFYNTALHEIGHSLGYNVTHLKALGLLESSSEAPYALDDVFTSPSTYWYYVGENGVEQYQQTYPDYFLAESTTQSAYLMETYTASGSYASHVSSILGTYYQYLNQRDGMTYAISPNFEATITNMTLGVLEDLGYTVDYDFADPIGSPSPEQLTSEAVGKSVVLNWTASAGDLSNSESGQARYQLERLDVTNQLAGGEEDWAVVATDVEGTSWIDSTVEAGHEYSYRVRACYIRSNEEVGVYRAQAGDTITWESDESKFTIYALVNNGSDMVGWTRVVSSTSNKSWTVTELSKTPEDGTTLYRVVAVGAILTETEASKISNVAISTRADDYVPEGYSADDWRALKIFLETTDENGVKNGYKIDGVAYSPDFLQNVTGSVWQKVDGVYRLTSIDWVGYGLVGDLDLTGCSEVAKVNVKNNSIAQVELDSFNVTVLNVSSNNLTTLDVSALVALESLSCADNEIETLSVSSNLNLIYLDSSETLVSELALEDVWNLSTLKCAGTALETLSLAANKELTVLSPWTDSLEYVYLPSGFAGTVSLSDSSASSYEWVADDNVLGRGSSLAFTGADVTVVATLSFEDHTQTVVFYVGQSGEKPAAPSNLTFGALENGQLTMTWIDEAIGEIGYKVYCRVNDGDWTLIDSIVSSPEVSATTGSVVARTAVGINTSNVYEYKVCAYRIASNGAEIESDPATGSYVVETGSQAPMNFVAYDYNAAAETLQLRWDATDNAEYYEVQYRRSDDGGATWLNSWTHAETLSETHRTAVYVHEESYYGFRVRAVAADGTVSDWTELVYSHVATLTKPETFVASDYNIYKQTLELAWSSVESAVSYEVQYRVSSDNGATWSLWTCAETLSESSRTARGVYASCSYEFRVRARSAAGDRSDWTLASFEYSADASVALLDAAFTQELFDEDTSSFI